MTESTDLVTISIGGNDLNLFPTFVSGRGRVPASVVPEIGRRVTAVLRAVHDKAPEATVVYVGYPRLADPGAACPKRTPFSAEHLTMSYTVQEKLNRELKKAADATGTLYVDLFAASKGHGICSDSPWINGQENLLGVAAAYHPFVVEQEAATFLIDEVLG